MDREKLKKRIAEYKAQEEALMINFHRVQGARIALEQVIEELYPIIDEERGNERTV